MKRKLTAAIMAACMVTGLLAGCGDSAADSSGSTSGDTQTEAVQESSTTTEAEAAPELSEEDKQAQEKVKMNIDELLANGLEIEDTDLTGEFSYWSAFTGDSAVWEQSRVDAFNELYADKGIMSYFHFVPVFDGVRWV